MEIKFDSFVSSPEDNLGELPVTIRTEVVYSQGAVGSLSNAPGIYIEDMVVMYRDSMTGDYRNISNQLSERDLEALRTQAVEWYKK